MPALSTLPRRRAVGLTCGNPEGTSWRKALPGHTSSGSGTASLCESRWFEGSSDKSSSRGNPRTRCAQRPGAPGRGESGRGCVCVQKQASAGGPARLRAESRCGERGGDHGGTWRAGDDGEQPRPPSQFQHGLHRRSLGGFFVFFCVFLMSLWGIIVQLLEKPVTIQTIPVSVFSKPCKPSTNITREKLYF